MIFFELLKIYPKKFKQFTYYQQLKKVPRLDIQRFVAEDEGRTELPTETKKRRAREKGQVLKSQEIEIGRAHV